MLGFLELGSCLSAEAKQPGSTGSLDESDEDDAVEHGGAGLTAEQGLKHLLLTVDVERLYRYCTTPLLLPYACCCYVTMRLSLSPIGSAQADLDFSISKAWSTATKALFLEG